MKPAVTSTAPTQENSNPYPLAKKVILLYALQRKVLSALVSTEVEYFKTHIYEFFQKNAPELIIEITEKKELNDISKQRLDDGFVAFFRQRDKEKT